MDTLKALNTTHIRARALTTHELKLLAAITNNSVVFKLCIQYAVRAVFPPAVVVVVSHVSLRGCVSDRIHECVSGVRLEGFENISNIQQKMQLTHLWWKRLSDSNV